jgi:hypothetical protein
MDILIKELIKVMKERGSATLVTVLVIVVSFAVGAVFEHYVEAKDHPIEQAVEKILKEHGIEKDFSENKKKDANGK